MCVCVWIENKDTFFTSVAGFGIRMGFKTKGY